LLGEAPAGGSLGGLALAGDGAGELHLAWEKAGVILVAVSPDGGATWAAPAAASGDHQKCTAPALVVAAGGEATVAWHDPSKGNEDVCAAHLTEGGAA